VGRRVTLLGVDEVRELGRVAEEEDGSVVSNDVPVALIGPELDRETTGVTGAIVRARLTPDGGEADCDGARLSRLEDVCQAEVIKRVGSLVNTVGSGALCMDDTLGDPLTVEVRDEIDQVEVLEEKRAVLAHALDLVRVGHRDAIAGGVDGV